MCEKLLVGKSEKCTASRWLTVMDLSKTIPHAAALDLFLSIGYYYKKQPQSTALKEGATSIIIKKEGGRYL